MNKALLLAFAVGRVRTYTDSLADCEIVAALFANTCTEVVDTADWSSATSEQIDCVGPNICVAGTSYDDSDDYSCSHQ